MMRPLHLAFALALLLPAGCGTWNPLVYFGVLSGPAHKPTPLAPITATVTPRAAWSVAVGKSGPYRLQPQADGGRIYAAAADGTLTVVEDSGRVAAKVETKKRFSGGLEIGDGKLFAATVKGEVVAFDASGKPVWTTNVAGEVIAPPTVAGGFVVVRTADGRIFALALNDGKRAWVFQRPMPALLLRSEAGVVPLGRDVVAGFPNGKMIAIALDDGKLTWEVNVTLPRGTTELERIADVAGLPLIEGNVVCGAAFQGKVACFDITSRNMIWTRDLSSARNLAVDAKYLYAVDDTGGVHALDKNSGASVWKNDKLLHRKVTSPVALEGHVIVGDGLGFLHVLKPEDGSIVGRMATDGSAITAMVPYGKDLIVQTANGQLSRVRF